MRGGEEALCLVIVDIGGNDHLKQRLRQLKWLIRATTSINNKSVYWGVV